MEQPNIFMSYLRVTQHMSQQFRSHFGRLDLTFPQALVLTVLGEDGPVPISALAERTGSANSTVSPGCSAPWPPPTWIPVPQTPWAT